jgi:cytochrome c oxidase cbb3-type subunit 3
VNGRSWVTAALTLLLLASLTAARFASQSAERARFLRAIPDTIPRDPELLQYALGRGPPAYAKHCASCHGAHLEGDKARAIPQLSDTEWLYGSGRIAELERTILYGIRSGNSKTWDLASMPAFARARPYDRYEMTPLTPSEIEDIVAYVVTFRKPVTDVAAVERGKRLFHDPKKGTCADCHASDGKGDSAIGAPDLTDDVWLSGNGSPQHIRDVVERGLAGSCPAWSKRLPPETIRAIAVYVHRVAEHQPTRAGGQT